MSDKIHLEYPNPIRVRGVVLYENGIILIKRNRIENGKEIEYYVFPGGGVENDEDLHSALTRELHEELGIEVTIREKIHEDVFNGNTNLYFLCEYKSGEIGTGNSPEFYSEKYKNRGSYIPIVVSFGDLSSINLYPISTIDKLKSYFKI